MNYLSLVEFCGEDAVASVKYRIDIEEQMELLEKERWLLENDLKNSFAVNLSLTDILVSTIAGIVCGVIGGLFKSYIPEKGKFAHEHTTTKTAIDYKVPKPEGMNGSAQGYHRQIGPGHDLGRFKEALDLISGEKKDFPLWGKNIIDYTGGVLLPGNMNPEIFIQKGGFRIPEDPKKELMHHLLIDFFTKTSLPLPFTSYLADYKPFFAKLMVGMYSNGTNMKSLVGNVAPALILQLITNAYVFLFKSAKEINLYEKIPLIKDKLDFEILFDDLVKQNESNVKSKEFNVMQAIAHASSFLVDTIITTTSKNYMGLFSLDYGTLVRFATHVIKYLIKGTADYNEILTKISSVDETIVDLNTEWYESFKADFLKMASNEKFYETFNPELIMEEHQRLIEKLKIGQEKRNAMLEELAEWKI